MPARFIIILLLLLLLLLGLGGCASAPAGRGTASSRQVTVIHGDFPVIANGMSADEVRQKLGAPAEIRQGKSNERDFEVWVYYLEKFLGKTEVVSFVNRPAMSGTFANDPFAMVPEPVYTMVDHKLLVTLRLVMLNGRLVSQTVKNEQLLGS